jgi:DNA-binding response OmpR family regulator
MIDKNRHSGATHARRPPSVLVADDDAKLRSLLGGALIRHGFEVQLVPDGREALAMFRRCSGEFDLVILNDRMPGMDGPETLTALRALDPAIPCWLITGDGSDYTPAELAGLGAACVFEKPLRLADLTAALLEAVGR